MAEPALKSNKFCPHCDFAITGKEWEELLYLVAVLPCPRCGKERISNFYSYGSHTHRERREAWERGEVSGNPPGIERMANNG